MRRTKRKKYYVLLLPTLLIIQGCALLRARPADDAGFIQHPELLEESNSRAPFNGYWVNDGKAFNALRKNYGRLYIAPIDTEIYEASVLASRLSDRRKRIRIQEAQQLAKYWHAGITLLFENAAKRNSMPIPIKVIETSEPDSLTLRLALVKLTPTNPGVNIIGSTVGFFITGGGLLKIAGEGSVAMEGFIHETGNRDAVYVEFKDREGQKTSFFTIKDFQQYAHIRSAIDDWSKELVALLTTPASTKVEGASLFSLNPL